MTCNGKPRQIKINFSNTSKSISISFSAQTEKEVLKYLIKYLSNEFDNVVFNVISINHDNPRYKIFQHIHNIIKQFINRYSYMKNINIEFYSEIKNDDQFCYCIGYHGKRILELIVEFGKYGFRCKSKVFKI